MTTTPTKKLTLKQLATALGLPVGTLRSWCLAGWVNSCTRTVGGARQWQSSDVLKVIDQIAKHRATRPQEKRSYEEIFTLLYTNWQHYKLAHPDVAKGSDVLAVEPA